MKTLIADIEALASSDAIDDAVRLSGEELARFDNIWRMAHNRYANNEAADATLPQDVADAIANVAEIAICHCDMLMRAGLFRDAYATAVTTIMSIAMEQQEAQLSQQMLALTALSCMALDALSDKVNPDDAHAATHFPVIARYCASMLYYWYSQTVSAAGVWHHRVTPLLRELIRHSAVESPEVTISVPTPGDQETFTTRTVSASDTNAILADLLGRSAALALLD